MTKLLQWSYSTYKAYCQCPRKVKLGKIDKIRDPGSPAMDRGNKIHKEAENYIKFREKEVPKSLIKFKEEFELLQQMAAVPEEEVAFTIGWKFAKWFGPDAWVRAKVDVYHKWKDKKGAVHMRVIDYKTGKVYPENKKQLSFYALLNFLRHPEVQTIQVELWYIDQGPEVTQEDIYLREEMPDMLEAWEDAVRPMLSDEIFAPRPNQFCKYCFYGKDKLHCEFGNG